MTILETAPTAVVSTHARRCVVTGGTGGIGLATARALAVQGMCVLLIGRDPERGRAACADIDRRCGVPRAAFLAADLSDLSQLKRAADAIADRWEHIDVLVNNAGAMFRRRELSAQGLEMTLALNHLSYFALSLLLLPKLEAAPAGGRIVNVASEAHRFGRLDDLEDLQSPRHYRGWRAYGASKLANLLFTFELARRTDQGSITVNALHPGFVATAIGTRHGLVPRGLWRLATLAALSPEQGARTSVYLAGAPEVRQVHGGYFIRGRPVMPAAAAQDMPAAARLWDISLRLTGLSPRPGTAGTAWEFTK